MPIILKTNIKNIPTLHNCLKHLEAKGIKGLSFFKENEFFNIAIEDFNFEVAHMAEIDKGDYLEKFNAILREVSAETTVSSNIRVAFIPNSAQNFIDLRLQLIKNTLNGQPELLTELFQDLLAALKNISNKYETEFNNWKKANDPSTKQKSSSSAFGSMSSTFNPVLEDAFRAEHSSSSDHFNSAFGSMHGNPSSFFSNDLFSPSNPVSRARGQSGHNHSSSFWDEDSERIRREQIDLQNKKTMFDTQKDLKKRECKQKITGMHSQLISAFEKILIDTLNKRIDLNTLNLNSFEFFNFNTVSAETSLLTIDPNETDAEKSCERVVIKIQNNPANTRYITDDMRQNYYDHFKLLIEELKTVLQMQDASHQLLFEPSSCSHAIIVFPGLTVTKRCYKDFEFDLQRALFRTGLMNDYHLGFINHYRTDESLRIELLKQSFAEQYTPNTRFDAELALRRAAALNHFDNVAAMITVLKVNVNAQAPDSKRTALHWAVIKGSAACAKLLLEKGARTDLPDTHGKTAKEYAEASDNEEIKALFTISPSLGMK